jgi:hypothetical protein
MSKDKNERRHRRTVAHPESVKVMAEANFAAAPSLSKAIGLEPDIEGLSVDSVKVLPVSGQTVRVTLDGINADDFVACCSESLLQEIVAAAGAFFEED